MGKNFEVVFEGEFPATPDQVWDAVLDQTSGWLFPTEGMEGEQLILDRPHHHINRLEGPDGWFNQLEQVIEPRDEGRSYLRWVHSGVLPDDQWDTQYDGVSLHTAFYLHTLAEYLEHFAPGAADFVDVQGPDVSNATDSFEVVRAALGLSSSSVAGDTTTAELPGASSGAIVDYTDENFIGLRTDNALVRFFGRNRFGSVVGLTVHTFGEPSATEVGPAWKSWLDGLFG
jgi:hypothetical protein